jgi:hypothetical protein
LSVAEPGSVEPRQPGRDYEKPPFRAILKHVGSATSCRRVLGASDRTGG